MLNTQHFQYVSNLIGLEFEKKNENSRGIKERHESINWSINFSTGNKNYWIQCEVVDEAVHVVGNNEEARMVELFVKVRINGKINGRGICEYNYNNAYYQKIIKTTL